MSDLRFRCLEVFLYWLTLAVTFYWCQILSGDRRRAWSILRDSLLWPWIAAQGFYEAVRRR